MKQKLTIIFLLIIFIPVTFAIFLGSCSSPDNQSTNVEQTNAHLYEEETQNVLNEALKKFITQQNKTPAKFSDFIVLNGYPPTPKTLSLEYGGYTQTAKSVKGIDTDKLIIKFANDSTANYYLKGKKVELENTR